MKTEYSALLERAMEVAAQEEADKIFDRMVTLCISEKRMPRQRAEKIQRENLGYFAGYHGDETRRRVERLFKCAHPVFGAISENGPPTPKQAFAAGLKMGTKARLAAL